MTRSAVCGLVARMGLVGRRERMEHGVYARKLKPSKPRLIFGKPVDRQPPMRPKVLPPPEVTDIPRKLLEDLEDHDCRYPTREINGRHWFCADKRCPRKFLNARSPYCEAHHFRALNNQ
jgi:hypothetical protein